MTRRQKPPPLPVVPDLGTPAGLLRHLLVRNREGVWFVMIDYEQYVPLPRWMWAWCWQALPDARVLE